MDGLVQDCSYSTALAVELMQSRTKPPTWYFATIHHCCSSTTKMVLSLSGCLCATEVTMGDIIKIGQW